MTYYSFDKQRRRRFGFDSFWVIGIVVALLAVGGIVFGVHAYKSTQRVVTTTVTDKGRVCSGSSNGNSSCKYLIYTDDGTYKLTDTVIYGRFNTSDVYGRIRRDHTYRFTVVGWRIPVFSSYPNIIKVSEAAQ